MLLIPIITPVTKIQTPPPVLTVLPVGYPVYLVRDWYHPLSPHAIGVWLRYFSHEVRLGYLPPAIACQVAPYLDADQIVSTYLLQYMRVAMTPPVLMVKIMVRSG